MRVILALSALALAYAVARIRALGFDLDLTAVPAVAWAALAAVALGWRIAFRLGRARQRTAHAFVVWKGHPR